MSPKTIVDVAVLCLIISVKYLCNFDCYWMWKFHLIFAIFLVEPKEGLYMKYYFYHRQQSSEWVLVLLPAWPRPSKKCWAYDLQLAFRNLKRINIQNHLDQTSLREDSSFLSFFVLDFTLFYVKEFWTVGFKEFGDHLIREQWYDLAVDLPLGSRGSSDSLERTRLCASVWTWWMSGRCRGRPIKVELN